MPDDHQEASRAPTMTRGLGAADFPYRPDRIALILHHLIDRAKVEGWNISSLGRAAGLNTSDTTRYLAFMEERGLLESTRVSERKSIVKPTKLGEEHLRKWRQVFYDLGIVTMGHTDPPARL